MNTTVDISSPEVRRGSFGGVDIVKFLCALLILSIHVNPLADGSQLAGYIWVNGMTRAAVPFFFIASGYFCFRDTRRENFDFRVPLKYALRIWKLYLIWTAIYALPIVWSVLQHEDGVLVGTVSTLRVLVVAGYRQLWYLNSLPVSLLLVGLSLKWGWSWKRILTVGMGLYLVGMLGDAYYGALAAVPLLQRVMAIYIKIFTSTRNGLFFGFLFGALGALLSQKPISIRPWAAWAGFALSMALAVGESVAVMALHWDRDHNMYLFLVPAAFFLFYIAAQARVKGPTGALRFFSSFIYYIHCWIHFPGTTVLTAVMAKLTGNPGWQMSAPVRFSLVLALSLGASWAVYRLRTLRAFRWLKHLG